MEIFFERIAGDFGNGKMILAVNSSVSNTSVTGADHALTIDTNKNVGIGTTGPNDKLEVSAGNIRISNNSPMLRFMDTDVTDLQHRVLGGGNSGLEYSADVNNVASGYHRWDISNSEKMRLIENGNLGIGATSPVSGLQISTNTTGDANRNTTTAGITLTRYINGTDYRGSSIFHAYQGVSGSDKELLAFAVGPGNSNSPFDFAKTKMVITEAGSIGIGTTTPNAKLDIQGTQGQLFSVTDDLSGSIFAVADISGVPIFDVNSSGVSYFDGNVGIGETSPSATLHVKNAIGNYPFIVETPYDRVGKLISTDSGADLIIQDSNSTDNGNSISVVGDTMGLNTAGSNRIKILANGNVGIGTTSPLSKLTIDAPVGNFANGTNAISLNYDGGSSPGDVGGGIVFSQKWWSASAGQQVTGGIFGIKHGGNGSYGGGLGFYTQPNGAANMAQHMVIRSTGEVGIGNTSPDKLLHVGDGLAQIGSPQGAEIEGYNNTLDLKTNEANSIADFTAALNLFCDGVVGSSGTGTGIYFRAKTGGGGGGEYTKGRIQGAVYTSWTTNTDATRTSKLVLQTTNSGTHADRVTILGNGDFGINDTSPSNKLDVNGDIRGTQYKLRGNITNPSTTAATIYDQSGIGLTFSAHNIELRNYNGSSMVRSVFFTHNSATFTGTCTATNFILSSDETLKENIKDIDNKHIDVNWKSFELKSEPGVKRSGVIAQELETKHPEFVRTNKDGLKSVAYIDLLIAKIAELEARLEKAGI